MTAIADWNTIPSGSMRPTGPASAIEWHLANSRSEGRKRLSAPASRRRDRRPGRFLCTKSANRQPEMNSDNSLSKHLAHSRAKCASAAREVSQIYEFQWGVVAQFLARSIVEALSNEVELMLGVEGQQ